MSARLAVIFCLLLAFGAAAANRLQIVPDADADVTAGWAAYRAMDFSQALVHYRRAAERNQRVAQFNLAVMLLGGEGTAADPVSGVAWLRKSADLGFAQAQFALALLYERGEHLARSQSEATAWFHRAA
jgi:TPR repeat protein